MTDGPGSTVLTITDDLPVRSCRPVHGGKVRSVYWLQSDDSRRLIAQRGYEVPEGTELALMVISDRLSAFDCLWRSESLAGVPGKGAALNAISAQWFHVFSRAGLPHHLLEMPHPMLWIVRQARPIMIEAIARRYLTGSLWRAYEKGARDYSGSVLPDGLPRYARLPRLLFTPSTKGVHRGLPGVPEYDDAPVSEALLEKHFEDFGFAAARDVARCAEMLRTGFDLVSDRFECAGELLVDTKFEFGYAPGSDGSEQMIIMDEVGTPDSSRVWAKTDWESGHPREHSKELFREALLDWAPDCELLLDSDRMAERADFAARHPVPDAFFTDLSFTYRDAAQRVTGRLPEIADNPRESLLELLAGEFGLVD